MKGKISRTGYKKSSPDRFNDFNVIPSNNITMENVDQYLMLYPMGGPPSQPMLAEPGKNYTFPGHKFVLEVPMKKQQGGQLLNEQEVTQWNDFLSWAQKNKLGLDANLKEGRPYVHTNYAKYDTGTNYAEDWFNEYRSVNPAFKLKSEDVKRAQNTYAQEIQNVPVYYKYWANKDPQGNLIASPTEGWLGSLTLNQFIPPKNSTRVYTDWKKNTTVTNEDTILTKPVAGMKHGGIHIKPENKGKFTAYAKAHGKGVQEMAAHILANREDYSSTQIKRANFARNAGKWKKEEGGGTGSLLSKMMSDMQHYGSPGRMQMGGKSAGGDTYMNKTSSFVDWLKKTSYNTLVDEGFAYMKELSSRKQYGGEQTDIEEVIPEVYIPAYDYSYNTTPEAYAGYMQMGGTQDSSCSDQDRMDPTSPCYDPGFVPGYVSNVNGIPTPADNIYSPTGSRGPIAPLGRAQSASAPAPKTPPPGLGIPGGSEADALIAGMNYFANLFNQDDLADRQKWLTSRTHADKVFSQDRRTDRGKYTVNEGYFDPMSMTPIQFKGFNTYNPYAQEGGSFSTQEEYYLTDEEIQKILDAGGSVEYLD